MLFACTACAVTGKQASQYDFSSVDGLINRWVERNYYPGASISIANEDGTLFEKSYGNYTADKEVYVASCGKWIAVAVIGYVVDNTPLDWNDEIKRWLPEFSNDVKGTITLRQLCSHTSGIPDYHKKPKMDVYNRLDSAVMDILPLDTVFTPGSRFQYGGLAMQIAGRMAEVAMKDNFENIFQSHIAIPLEMNHSHFLPVDMAEGHNPMLGGAFKTTLNDYMHFLNMIFHDGEYEGTRILSKKVVKEMQANQIGNAEIPKGEYVETALGETHSGIYGLGQWREKVDENDNAYQISSPSWAGAYPWINKKDGVYGFFITHVEGNSAIRDNFSPFLNAPLISSTVSKIINTQI